MNRENKKRSFEKGYYKNHTCQEAFTCKVCGRPVVPGDRESDCGGYMDPVAVWVRKNGEWAIIHRCRVCGAFSSNRVAADDNPMKLMSIAMKPLAMPPFPIDRIEEMTRLMGGDGSM